MKWVLVFIVIENGEVHSDYIHHFDNMTDCFIEREILALHTGSDQSGHYLPGMQGLCVKTEEWETR